MNAEVACFYLVAEEVLAYKQYNVCVMSVQCSVMCHCS